MTEAQITQCPKCHTTFRVTPAQLQVAKGAVRCGACLHVFKAAEHFQGPSLSDSIEGNSTTAIFDALALELSDDPTLHDNGQQETVEKLLDQPVKSAKPAKKEEFDPFDDDNLLISDDMDIDFDDDDDEDDGLIQDEPDNTQLLSSDDDDFLIDDSKGIDEDELIYDDHEVDNQFANDLNEEFLSLDTSTDDVPLFHDSDSGDKAEKEEADESWAEALLDDSEPAPNPADEFLIDDAQYGRLPFDDHPQNKRATAAQLEPNSPAHHAQPASLGSLQSPHRPNVSYIQDNPIELHLPQQSRGRGLMWFVLCALLAGGLVVQIAMINLAQWSRDPSLRPYYDFACQFTECQLPPIYNIAKIHTTATPQVKSHAKYQDALTVDILFRNDADYEQPFPLLELSFLDGRDKVVAQRRFHPNEYLAGEGAGMEMMPVRVPIHISLDIRDPSAKTSSYRVKFLPNQ